MTKERVVEGKRKRDNKVSDDKVIKAERQKKRAKPPSTTSDEDSDGGALVNIKSPEDVPVIVALESADKRSIGGKKTTEEKKSKKETQVKAEADDDTIEGGALLFSIDTNPTPVNLSTVKTKVSNWREEKARPEQTNPFSGGNRRARRRAKSIEKQREHIRQKMGIPEGSREREDEVQRDLNKWIKTYDHKSAVRVRGRRERKARELVKMMNKERRKAEWD